MNKPQEKSVFRKLFSHTYIKDGWNGQLSFWYVLWYMDEASLFYIVFYVLLAFSLLANPLSLGLWYTLALIWAFTLGIMHYIWTVRSLWLSANHCKSSFCRYSIRTFVFFLPIISIIAFFIILVIHIILAIVSSLSG